MAKNKKQQNKLQSQERAKQQTNKGYTGDKKLGGPNRPAE